MDPLKQLIYLLDKRSGPLKALGRICPLEFHYGVVPNQGPRDCTVADRVLLVGDSAGQLNPLLLEGIRFAIRFGRIAGKAAKNVIEKDGAVRLLLDEYEEEWKKEIWSDFHLGLNVQKKWLKLSNEQWDKEISILNSLPTKAVLELLQAQFSTRNLTRLIVHHPELLKSQSFSVILPAKMKRALSTKTEVR